MSTIISDKTVEGRLAKTCYTISKQHNTHHRPEIEFPNVQEYRALFSGSRVTPRSLNKLIAQAPVLHCA